MKREKFQLSNLHSGQINYEYGLIGIGEVKEGEWYRKRTAYFEYGEIEN